MRMRIGFGVAAIGVLLVSGCDFRDDVSEMHPSWEFIEVCESQIRQLQLHRDGGAENLNLLALISSIKRISALEWRPRTAFVDSQLEHVGELEGRLDYSSEVRGEMKELEIRLEEKSDEAWNAKLVDIRTREPVEGEVIAALEGECEQIRSQILSLIKKGAMDEGDEGKYIDEAYRKAIIEIAGWIDEANAWRRIEIEK